MAQRQPAGQLAAFRVYPEPRSRLYYLVRVFRSIKAARAYTHQAPHLGNLGRYGLAQCTTYSEFGFDDAGRERKRPIMGEIVLPTRGLTMEVITHEVTHAAIGWFRRLGAEIDNPIDRPGATTNKVSEDEERFCYGLGRMARQIAVRTQRWQA